MASFAHLACRRRSHRQYTDETVDDQDIRTILRAALMSPSARARRNWSFLVSRDKSKIGALSQIREHGSGFLAGAPVIIAVAGQPSENDLWREDCAIAAVSMQYQAADLGLGSCWCHVFGREGLEPGSLAEDKVKEILGIPEDLSVLCVLGIGHWTDERKVQEDSALRWDRVHFESFGPESQPGAAEA